MKKNVIISITTAIVGLSILVQSVVTPIIKMSDRLDYSRGGADAILIFFCLLPIIAVILGIIITLSMVAMVKLKQNNKTSEKIMVANATIIMLYETFKILVVFEGFEISNLSSTSYIIGLLIDIFSIGITIASVIVMIYAICSNKKDKLDIKTEKN